MGCKNAISILLVFMLIFNCILITSPYTNSYSNNSKDILSFSFLFSEPIFNEYLMFNNSYTTLDISGCIAVGNKIGEPVLPVKYVKILIPRGKKVVDVQIDGTPQKIESQKIDLVNQPIIPYQTPVPIGKEYSNDLDFNDNIYHSFDVYSLDNIVQSQISYCRGYTILSLNLNPVQYIPGRGEIRYIPEMTFNIELEESNNINTFYRNEEDDERWIENLVNNPDVTNSYNSNFFMSSIPIFEYSGGLCDPSEDYDYVIITTTDNGLDHWETNPTIPYNWSSLIEKHETDDGLNCTLITIQEINDCTDYWDTNSLFNDTPAHIREFCRDAYQDWGTDYIFIGGDDDLIPAREMDYAYESDVDSDIYWNHLDNTFNDDEDSKWGEEGDDGFDLYSEMYLGRITCDVPQDVSNWMKKSFYYADSSTVDYINRAAFYGGNSGWDCEGDDFIDYSAIKGTNDWLGPDPDVNGPYPSWLGFQYGFETWNTVNPGKPFNLTVKWTEEPTNSGWSGGSESVAINGLKNAINNDECTLISGVAHADELHSLNVYYTSWEADYHNTKPFFLHDYGCHSGDMDAADDGVLHSMLFHSDTELAFACVLNTGFGWGNGFSTNCSSSLQQKCFWDYLFDTTNNSGSLANWQLGKAMAHARDTMAPTLNWDPVLGTWRAIIQGCLLFGDPAQKLKIGPEDQIILSDESPTNQTVGLNTGNIELSVNILDPEGNPMNITFKTNASGSWQDIITYSSQQNGIYSTTYSFNTSNTKYWWSVNTYDTIGGSNWTNETYYFTTRDKYIPDLPSNFNASKVNHSCIALSWANAGDNKTYIEYNTTADNWLKGNGNFLDNSSNTSLNHVNLIPGTTYYYRAWSWNETDRCYSNTSVGDNATTDANNEPSISDLYPENASINQQRRPICNVTCIDSDLDNLNVYFYENTTGNWVLQQTNLSVQSGSNVIWNNYTNASSYNTTFWWSVNITDGYNWTNETYHFTTEILDYIYIDDDYDSSTQDWLVDHFDSIQKGIDNVTNGGIIEVFTGTYNENVIVNKSLTLKANDSAIPVINGIGSIGVIISRNDTTIQDMTITNSSIGIKIYNDSFFVHNITLYNNTIHNNSQDGIYFMNANNNSVISNIIDNNSYNGLLLQSSSDNSIKRNSLFSNLKNGTCLISSSDNNIIYHNNLFNNTKNNSYDECSNTWYNTTLGGNYWGDYNGTDSNNDGFGDTPYLNISGGTTNDTYPLIKEYEYYYILSINVSSSINENTQFTVTIETEGETTIQGALVEFNGQSSQTSDSNGQVTFTTPSVSSDTSYDIIALKTNYTSCSVSITVIDVSSGGGDGDGDGDGDSGTLPIIIVTTDDEKPSIKNINHIPTIVTSEDIVTISATVTDDNQIKSVILFWDDTSVHSKQMIITDNNIYSSDIGPFNEMSTINYWINATDNISQYTLSDIMTFTIIDNSGPSITNILPIPDSTIYDTTPTIQAYYNDPSEINFDSISLYIDNFSVTPNIITQSNMVYIPDIKLSQKLHTINLTLSDMLGNANTKKWSFTIAESEFFTEQNLGNIKKHEEEEISFEDFEESEISSIKFISSIDISEMKVIVTELDEKPEGILTEPTDKIMYQYLDVDFLDNNTNLENSDIESLSIIFKVRLQWIEDNNIDKQTIKLMNYENGLWQTIDTEFIGEDTADAYFEVYTENPSLFVIVGEKPIKPIEDDHIDDIPWIFIVLGIVAAIILIIIILFKTGYLYFEEKRM